MHNFRLGQDLSTTVPHVRTYVRTPLCRRKLAPLSQLLIHFIPCHAILEITQIMQQIKCIILILVFHETYTSYENEDQRRNSLNSIEYGKHYLILSSFASCVIYLVEPNLKKCTCVMKSNPIVLYYCITRSFILLYKGPEEREWIRT